MNIDVKKFFRRLARLASFAVKAFQPTVTFEFTGRAPAEYKKKHFRAKLTGREGITRGRRGSKYQELKLACLPIELREIGFVVQCLEQNGSEVNLVYYFAEVRKGKVQRMRRVRAQGVPECFENAPPSLSHLPVITSQPQIVA